ncbi:MAG: hypothetical protein R2795_12655 [Saprospiraceae bacterium]
MLPEQRTKIESIIQHGYQHYSSISLSNGLKIFWSRFRDLSLYAMIIPLVGTLLSMLGMGNVGTLILIVVVWRMECRFLHRCGQYRRS